MLKRRRRILIALVVLLVAAAIGLAVWLRKKAPPDAVRLLPEVEDGVLYLNLKPLRIAGVLAQTQVPREPEYEQFVRETGFEFERDLDQAAFAVHGPAAAGGATRYSEIFVGRFDGARLTAYLRKLAGPSKSDQYQGTEIFVVPHEGRRVRVAILGVDTVGASNLDDPAAIHEIIDHYRAAAVPRGGPALVRAHYHDVLFGSLAWFIGNIGSVTAQGPRKGLDIPMLAGLLGGSTLVGSVRYTGSVHLKIEAFTASEQRSREITKNLQAVLSVFGGGEDPDVKEFVDSIRVEQKDQRVVLTATMPQGFIRKMMTEPPPAPVVTPSPTPAPTPKKRRR